MSEKENNSSGKISSHFVAPLTKIYREKLKKHKKNQQQQENGKDPEEEEK
jgi:hypothetical protein